MRSAEQRDFSLQNSERQNERKNKKNIEKNFSCNLDFNWKLFIYNNNSCRN